MDQLLKYIMINKEIYKIFIILNYYKIYLFFKNKINNNKKKNFKRENFYKYKFVINYIKN